MHRMRIISHMSKYAVLLRSNLGWRFNLLQYTMRCFRADTIDQMMLCIVFMSVASTPVHMQCLQLPQLRCNVFSSDALYSPLSQCVQSICNVSSPYAILQFKCNVLRSFASTPVHMQCLQSICNVFCSVAMSAAPVRRIHLSDRMYQTPANCCNLNLSPCS